MKKILLLLTLFGFSIIGSKAANATYKTFNIEVSKYKFTTCGSQDSILVDTLRANLRLETYSGLTLYASRSYNQVSAGTIVTDSIDFPDGNYTAKILTEPGTTYECISDNISFIISSPPPIDTIPPPPIDTTLINSPYFAIHFSEQACATPQQETLMAQRFKMIEDGGCSKDMDAVKSMNPSSIWWVYNSGTDNYVAPAPHEEHTWLVNRTQELGLDSEIIYQHYWNNTTVILEGITVTIPGYGGGTATSLAQARVPMYYAEKTRILTNFSTQQARQVHTEYNAYFIESFHPNSTSLFDAIFFDNSADILYNHGSIQSGGAIYEHPTHAVIGSPEYQNWYWANSQLFFKAVKDTLNKADVWGLDHKKKLTGGGSLIGGGVWNNVFLEYSSSPMRMLGTFFDSQISLNRKADSLKTSFCYESFPITSISGYSGNVSYAQAILDNIATFYIIKSNSSYIAITGTYASYTPGWDTLTWRDCMRYDIGKPLADFNPNFYSGIDGREYQYRIRSRQYEKALVLVRPRGDYWQHIDDATLVDIPLGGNYQRLNPDGTLGSVITTIKMRNGQGEILIPLGTPPPPPTYNFKKAKIL